MMKRAVLWFTRSLIAIGLLATAIGTAYSIDPTLFNYFFEFAGLTPEEIGSLALPVGLLSGLGITSKILKTSVNTDLLALKVHYEDQLALVKNELVVERETHAQEILSMQERYESQYSELMATNKALYEVDMLILQSRVNDAKRIISYDFTSDEDKEKAELFIKSVEELTKEV